MCITFEGLIIPILKKINTSYKQINKLIEVERLRQLIDHRMNKEDAEKMVVFGSTVNVISVPKSQGKKKL